MSTQTQTQTQAAAASTGAPGSLSLRSPARTPLRSTGVLAHHKQFDSKPVIGREFPELQLTKILKADNGDDLIRELAVIVSERGVVFFRAQDIDVAQQKELGLRLGRLSGNPQESGLHVHPVTAESSELGDKISVIDSQTSKVGREVRERHTAAQEWHSGQWLNSRQATAGEAGRTAERKADSRTLTGADITFEPVPSDFAILKVHTLPKTGGDTLWASAYEARAPSSLHSFASTRTQDADHDSVLMTCSVMVTSPPPSKRSSRV